MRLTIKKLINTSKGKCEDNNRNGEPCSKLYGWHVESTELSSKSRKRVCDAHVLKPLYEAYTQLQGDIKDLEERLEKAKFKYYE